MTDAYVAIPSGSSSTPTFADITITSGTGTNEGPLIDLFRGASAVGQIGAYGRIIGGTAPNLTIYTGDEMYIFAGNGSAAMGFDYLGNCTVGAISATGTSAKLEVQSTTKGFLPPRMTTAQRNAIGSPTAGLMIYNTSTNKLNVRTASTWEVITSA